jgi:hypothetical protein
MNEMTCIVAPHGGPASGSNSYTRVIRLAHVKLHGRAGAMAP